MKSRFVFFTAVFFGLYFDTLNIFKFCILSSILHEAGHVAAYIIILKQMPKIKITIFGFVMQYPRANSKNLWLVTLCGPLVNITACCISFLLLQIKFTLNLYVFMWVNAVIFAFNMLPVYYLDGGHILYDKFAWYQRYYRIISGMAMAVMAAAVMLVSSEKFSLRPVLATLLYFFINMSNDI